MRSCVACERPKYGALNCKILLHFDIYVVMQLIYGENNRRLANKQRSDITISNIGTSRSLVRVRENGLKRLHITAQCQVG